MALLDLLRRYPRRDGRRWCCSLPSGADGRGQNYLTRIISSQKASSISVALVKQRNSAVLVLLAEF